MQHDTSCVTRIGISNTAELSDPLRILEAQRKTVYGRERRGKSLRVLNRQNGKENTSAKGQGDSAFQRKKNN